MSNYGSYAENVLYLTVSESNVLCPVVVMVYVHALLVTKENFRTVK